MINEKDVVKVAQAIKSFRENLPMLGDLLDIEAQKAKMQYDSLLKRGFTPDQAMYFCVHSR